VYQLAGEPLTGQVQQLYTAVLLSENVLMKQAVSQSISNTDAFGLEALQALSQEPSYTTKETVLLQRWVGLRERQKFDEIRNLLNEMDNQFGFSDGNIRTLWLTLSLATPDYKPETGQARYQELISYTNPSQPFQLRENAFRYLFQIQSFEEQSIKNLIEACVHPVWRFRESARNLFKEVVKNPENKKLINQLKSTALPEKQKAYLLKVL